MGGAEDIAGRAVPASPYQAAAEQPGAAMPSSENPAAELIDRSHDERRRVIDSRLGQLLVNQPVYYYRHGDSTGTQG